MKDSSHNFPIKLHALLDVENPEVIGWTMTGNAFRINDMDRFRDEALPKYWRHTKMTSFQRQLNLYGFKKINHGGDMGAFYHPLFVRGKRDLLKDFKRSAIKSSAIEAELSYINRNVDKSMYQSAPEVEVAAPMRVKEVPKEVLAPEPSNNQVGHKRPLFSPVEHAYPNAFQSSSQSQMNFQTPPSNWGPATLIPQYALVQSSTVDQEEASKRQKPSAVVEEDCFNFDFFFERLKENTGGQPSYMHHSSSGTDLLMFDDVISDEEYMLLMEG